MESRSHLSRKSSVELSSKETKQQLLNFIYGLLKALSLLFLGPMAEPSVRY